MPRASFGLILANRAVVLGAMQARDLIELSQQAEASGVFDALWVGDSLLAKPRLEAVALAREHQARGLFALLVPYGKIRAFAGRREHGISHVDGNLKLQRQR